MIIDVYPELKKCIVEEAEEEVSGKLDHLLIFSRPKANEMQTGKDQTPNTAPQKA